MNVVDIHRNGNRFVSSDGLISVEQLPCANSSWVVDLPTRDVEDVGQVSIFSER